jgi:hypothetical protein
MTPEGKALLRILIGLVIVFIGYLINGVPLAATLIVGWYFLSKVNFNPSRKPRKKGKKKAKKKVKYDEEEYREIED